MTVTDRSINAADEVGRPVAVEVWCGTCGSQVKRPLGQVRRSSVGLVFDAINPGGVTFQPGHREFLRDQFKRRGAGRMEVDVAAGRNVALIEDREEMDREDLAVECHGHRIEMDARALIECALGQRGGRPAKLVVHH